MFCPQCSAPLLPNQAVVLCAHCGSMIQIADVVLASDLRVTTHDGSTDVLVGRHTALPTEAMAVYSTAWDDQTEAEITLTQGDHLSPSENKPVGVFIYGPIRPAPKTVPRVRFNIHISREGDLKISGSEDGTQNVIQFSLAKVFVNKRV